MEEAKTVDVLDIALLEVESQGVLLSEKLQGIKSFCLSFSYHWNMGSASLFSVSGEQAPCVLDDDVAILPVEQRLGGVSRVPTKAIASDCEYFNYRHGATAHLSCGQGSASTRIKSGRVAAISL